GVVARGVKRLRILGPGQLRADPLVLVLILILLLADAAEAPAAESKTGVEGVVVAGAVLGQLQRFLFLADLGDVEVVIHGVGEELLVGRWSAIGRSAAERAAEFALLFLLRVVAENLVDQPQLVVAEAFDFIGVVLLLLLLQVLFLLPFHEFAEPLFAEDLPHPLLLFRADGAGRLGRRLAELGERPGAQVEFELVLIGHELELGRIVAQRHAGQRQLQRGERLLHLLGKLRRQLDAVEQRLLGRRRRVHAIPLLALAGAIFVPERVGLADPVGSDGGAVNELSQELVAVLVGLSVIGAGDALVSRRLRARGLCRYPAGQTGQRNQA